MSRVACRFPATSPRPGARRVLTSRARRGALLVAFLATGLASPESRADGFIYVENPPHLVPRPRRVHSPRRPHFPLEVTRHRVDVVVEDTVVTTRVKETFYNPNHVQLEGTYMFPLPDGAAVSDFRMKIGGKHVSGEILEKGRARELYESIVRRARDPGLLEYVGRELFRMRVFPIPPRGGVDVEIEYSEALRRDHGVTRYRYPLDTGKYSAGDYRDVVVDVRLRSSAPLRAIHCPSHEVAISRSGEREARVSFEAARLRADSDFILVWNVGDDALAPVLVTHRGHEDRGYFYLSVSPRPLSDRPPPPKDVVFVIDTSGSMLGTKIAQVKKALQYCLRGLNTGDRFNIVDFSTEGRRFREALVGVDETSRKQASMYVEELLARGGTNLEEGLRLALQSLDHGARPGPESRLEIVVLLTDGEPTIGVTRTEDLLASVRKHSDGRRVFVFGVGEDINVKLLDLLVKQHRGAAEYIRSQENLEVPLSNFFDKIDSPVLTDVTVSFPGARVEDVYPRPLPDLFRGEQLDLFGRYERDGTKTVVIKGRFWGEPHVFEYSLDFRGGANDHVSRLWATVKIGYLLEQIRLSGETREVKEEVIRLSKLHGVITPYTSYLILEEGALQTRVVPGAREYYRYAARDALGLRAGEDGSRPAAASAARLRKRAADEAQDFDAVTGARAVERSVELKALKEGKGGGVDKFIEEAVNVERQQVKKAGEKTFYRQGSHWVDAVLVATKLKTGEEIRVKYLSDEYFALLWRFPGIGRLLAVGPEVSFVWDGKLVVVSPDSDSGSSKG